MLELVDSTIAYPFRLMVLRGPLRLCTSDILRHFIPLTRRMYRASDVVEEAIPITSMRSVPVAQRRQLVIDLEQTAV